MQRTIRYRDRCAIAFFLFAFVQKPAKQAQLYIRRVVNCHPKYLMEIRNGAEVTSFFVK